jgi:enolase
MIVKNIKFREIYSHNLLPTVEIEIETSKGKVRASAPIGTSSGFYEAKYLPLDIIRKKFLEIKKELERKDFKNIIEVDNFLIEFDGTKNFSNIGANLSIAISYAFAKTFSLIEGIEIFEYISQTYKTDQKIPIPVCNVIGGGKHFGGTDFQEFLLMGALDKSFKENVKMIRNCYYKIAEILSKEDKFFSFGRNIESAWITFLSLKKIVEILKKVKGELLLGIDVAASTFYDLKKERYEYVKEKMSLSKTEQLIFIYNFVKENEIFYVEDPFFEDDFVSFATLTKRLENKLIVGDDLYVTNVERLKKGIELKATNGAIVKPNQIGTITQTAEFVKLAKKNNIKIIFSHRSGETEDNILAHLAVGFGADYAKIGIAGERTVKINEFLRIEEIKEL